MFSRKRSKEELSEDEIDDEKEIYKPFPWQQLSDNDHLLEELSDVPDPDDISSFEEETSDIELTITKKNKNKGTKKKKKNPESPKVNYKLCEEERVKIFHSPHAKKKKREKRKSCPKSNVQNVSMSTFTNPTC